jgi:hypothetical protein
LVHGRGLAGRHQRALLRPHAGSGNHAQLSEGHALRPPVPETNNHAPCVMRRITYNKRYRWRSMRLWAMAIGDMGPAVRHPFPVAVGKVPVRGGRGRRDNGPERHTLQIRS